MSSEESIKSITTEATTGSSKRRSVYLQYENHGLVYTGEFIADVMDAVQDDREQRMIAIARSNGSKNYE